MLLLAAVAGALFGRHYLPVVVEGPVQSEYLSLKSENVLLKKMLGQVEGDVVVLGPAGESKTSGRLVWDKILQGGFLYLSGLPEAVPGNITLWVGEDAKQLVSCGEFAIEDGRIQSAYRAARPVFHPHVFVLTQGGQDGPVLARGSL